MKERLKGFAINDIFNTAEYGLLYQAAPTITIGPGRWQGRKKQNENIDGAEKIPILIIRRSHPPRLFGTFSRQEWEFDYHANRKAWMNSELFPDWLVRFDSYIGATQNVHAALLIDNASCHGSISNLPNLSNVTVFFFPKRTTSTLQAIDAGVIAALKNRYRTKQYERASDSVEEDDTEKCTELIYLQNKERYGLEHNT